MKLVSGLAAWIAVVALAAPARAQTDTVPPPPQPPPGAVPPGQQPESALPLPEQPPPPAPISPPSTDTPSTAVEPRALAAAPTEPQTFHRWYGWQTLLVDALSLGAIVLGSESKADALVGCGVMGYLVLPPVVHGTHRHVGKAFGSLGLRVGLPVTGALIGAGLGSGSCDSHGEDCSRLVPALAGFGIGVFAAIVLDSAVLAHEDVSEVSRPSVGREKSVPSVTLAPQLSLGSGRASFSLVGSF